MNTHKYDCGCLDPKDCRLLAEVGPYGVLVGNKDGAQKWPYDPLIVTREDPRAALAISIRIRSECWGKAKVAKEEVLYNVRSFIPDFFHAMNHLKIEGVVSGWGDLELLLVSVMRPGVRKVFEWNAPGGVVSPGGKLLDQACNELSEEAGLVPFAHSTLYMGRQFATAMYPEENSAFLMLVDGEPKLNHEEGIVDSIAIPLDEILIQLQRNDGCIDGLKVDGKVELAMHMLLPSAGMIVFD